MGYPRPVVLSDRGHHLGAHRDHDGVHAEHGAHQQDVPEEHGGHDVCHPRELQQPGRRAVQLVRRVRDGGGGDQDGRGERAVRLQQPAVAHRRVRNVPPAHRGAADLRAHPGHRHVG